MSALDFIACNFHLLRHGVTYPLQRFPFSSEGFWIRLRCRALGVPIIGSVLGTVRIVVDESRGLRVLFGDVRAQVFSKKGSVIFWSFLLHTSPSYSRGPKPRHERHAPMECRFSQQVLDGLMILLIDFIGGGGCCVSFVVLMKALWNVGKLASSTFGRGYKRLVKRGELAAKSEPHSSTSSSVQRRNSFLKKSNDSVWVHLISRQLCLNRAKNGSHAVFYCIVVGMRYLALLSSPLLPDIFPATNHLSNAFPKERIGLVSNMFRL